MTDDQIKTIVTVYAAVVATSALLLNFKSWFDSGVKLKLGLMPEGMVIGDRGVEEKDLVILTVTNRGGWATMITHMVLFEMMSWWQRWRIRPKASYVIPNPAAQGLPAERPVRPRAVEEVDRRDPQARRRHPGHSQRKFLHGRLREQPRQALPNSHTEEQGRAPGGDAGAGVKEMGTGVMGS
jgi:hypothetical protein